MCTQLSVELAFRTLQRTNDAHTAYYLSTILLICTQDSQWNTLCFAHDRCAWVSSALTLVRVLVRLDLWTRPWTTMTIEGSSVFGVPGWTLLLAALPVWILVGYELEFHYSQSCDFSFYLNFPDEHCPTRRAFGGMANPSHWKRFREGAYKR